MADCIFCKIVKGELETKLVGRQNNIVAFFDINPQASTHILIVTKEHIGSFLDIESKHSRLISEMIKLAQKLIKDYNLEDAYKVVFNGGRYQHVPHLHWHLLSDRKVV